MASSLHLRAVERLDEESDALRLLHDTRDRAEIEALDANDTIDALDANGAFDPHDPLDPLDSHDALNPHDALDPFDTDDPNDGLEAADGFGASEARDGMNDLDAFDVIHSERQNQRAAREIFPLSPSCSTAGALESLRALGIGLHSAREIAGAALQAVALPQASVLPAAPLTPAGPGPLVTWKPAEPGPLVTAVPALDELLAGGLPRGKLVEMVGGRSSGRFSAVLATLAAATAAGEAAALVDLGDGLDPQAAANLGMDLRCLLWLRPVSLKQALICAEVLLGGGFPLVVLDLGSPPVRGGRGIEAGWVRLARAAQAHRAALLVASPYRVSGTAAAIVLQATRGRVLWQGVAGRAPWLLDGLSCQVELAKTRGRLLPAQRTRRLDLRSEDTITLDTSLPSTATVDLPRAPARVRQPADVQEMPARIDRRERRERRQC